jgi:hypothetical protein
MIILVNLNTVLYFLNKHGKALKAQAYYLPFPRLLAEEKKSNRG